jgi:hemolysin D
MQKPTRPRSTDNKIVHLSPVPSKGQPLSRISRRYGELERTELLPELLSYALYGLLALLLCAVTWAALANVEVVAVAPARVMPSGDVKVVQPDIDGVIDSIAAREGQKVSAGDELAVLEPSRGRAEVDKRDAAVTIVRQQLNGLAKAKLNLQSAIANPGLCLTESVDLDGSAAAISELNSAYVRLREAELDNQILSGIESDKSALGSQSSSLSEQKLLQQKAYQERAAERQSKLAQKKIEIEQLKKSLESAKEEFGHIQTILNATTQQEESFRKVFQAGAVSRVDYLNMFKEVERTRRELTQQNTVIQELSKTINISESQVRELGSGDRASALEKKAQIKNLDFEIGKVGILNREMLRKHTLALADYQSSNSRAKALLERITLNLEEKQQQLREAEALLKIAGRDYAATKIEAPVSGTVTGIKLRGRGHVVKRGDRLMTVIPDGAPLAFEAAVANKDAGFVEAGQEVKIKLSAYPFEDFGVLKGKVIHIEATSESSNNPVFVAKIVPEKQYITVRGKKRPLVSGMTASCEIVTRKRPVLNILFEPFTKMQETRWQ